MKIYCWHFSINSFLFKTPTNGVFRMGPMGPFVSVFSFNTCLNSGGWYVCMLSITCSEYVWLLNSIASYYANGTQLRIQVQHTKPQLKLQWCKSEQNAKIYLKMCPNKISFFNQTEREGDRER